MTVGLALAFAAMPIEAHSEPFANPQTAQPIRRHLTGINDQEADELIAKVKAAQRALKSGEKLYFDLLSGAPASYEMNDVSPRTAFLSANFDRTWRVEHQDSGNPLWQPYRLSVISTKIGQLYWDIEVVIGANGQIERIAMFYRPPAPF
jgi:hypothetical protein